MDFLNIKTEASEVKNVNVVATPKEKVKCACPQCGTEVLDLKQHIRRVHEKKPEVLELKCKDCGRICTNRNQLSLHWSYVHKVVDNLYCNLCSKQCSNMSKLRQHTLTCLTNYVKMRQSPGFVPPIVEEPISNTISQVVKKTVAPVTKVTCNLCKDTFSSMRKLKRHTVNCLPKYLNQSKSIKEEIVTSNEKSHTSLMSFDSSGNRDGTESFQQEHACPECGLVCYGIGTLLRHRLKCYPGRNVESELSFSDEDFHSKMEPSCDVIIKEEIPDSSFFTQTNA